ncbi:MAG TPA: PIN domain-containing protein [Candidatus Saccharimonadales bacterium]|jgi:PIN domain nuclease of toxin-antitoxin system|nr:PIN domain-containing protein [Candidatus Saccharimonadales bacterium]
MIIDTNVLIWAVGGDKKLGAQAAEAIKNTPNLQISQASLYEIAIKERIGRFRYFETIVKALPSLGIQVAELSVDQLRIFISLAGVRHRDPFDIAIIALAIQSHQPLMMSDAEISKLELPGLKLIDARK